MKNLKLAIVSLALISSQLANGQFYLTSYGNVSIGTTVAPPSDTLALYSVGGGLFTNYTGSGSLNSAAYVHAYKTYSGSSLPDYTWWGDITTGLFHPAADILAITTGGGEKMRFTSASNGTIQFTGWTNVYLDWNHGDCCGTPALYPATSWYLQLGTPSYFVGDAYITHELYVTAPSLYSDRTIKKNINYNLDSSIVKLEKLKPASYNLDSTFLTGVPSQKLRQYCRKQYGLIAQDLAVYFPELVDTINGKLTVQYNGLIPILIDAVKKQQAQLDSMKQAMAECCNKNHDRSQRTQPDTGSGSQFQNSPMQQGSLPQNLQGAMLYQNTPNPFTQSTTIACYIPQQSGTASIMVFDMNGTLKKTFPISGKGSQNIVISGSQLIAGMYFYTLIIDNTEIATRKMILTQ